MINTNPLTQAAFEDETKEERMICRDLATSIEARSPYARKLYNSGEAAKCLSENSLRALETVLREDSKRQREIRARKRLAFKNLSPESPKNLKAKSVATSNTRPRYMSRFKGKGVKNCDSVSHGDDGKQKVVEEKGKAEMVKKNKGKEKIEEGEDGEGVTDFDNTSHFGVKVKDEPVEVDTDDDDENWEFKYGYTDIWVENESGELIRFDVYVDNDGNVESSPDIPMSPCTSSEWNPERHYFLLVRKGT